VLYKGVNFIFLILLQFSTNKISISYQRPQNSRLLTDFDIGVNGIPYDLKFMYTTCNQTAFLNFV